jgi:arylsulfatase A-like enzyme
VDVGGDTADATPPDDAETENQGSDLRPDDGRPPNIILLISDDLGLDASECYTVRDDVASTPNIRALCERGVVFDNAWAMPICSPTRASMLTGRYPYRTGVVGPAGGDAPGIDPDEMTLPRVLDAHPALGYSHANIGKWHLSGQNNSGNETPNRMGWDHFSGIIQGGVQDYFSWNKVVDGTPVQVNRYATTELVDDAIDWVGQQEEPFLLWLAFNAPHTPFHVPPATLHEQDLGPPGACPGEEELACYRAAIEAMDTEIGRLLASLPEGELDRTYVVYLGDNGTPTQVAQAPFRRLRAKNSLYEGGVHVPFVVAGPGVVDGGRRVDAIIDVTDVFATILELAGVTGSDWVPEGTVIDGASLVPYLRDPDQTPLRPWVMAQVLASSTDDPSRMGTTARDQRFKLIRFRDDSEAFYDLSVDPYEMDEILGDGPLDGDAADSYATLAALIDGVEQD